jgi:hypothetical protein
VVVIERRKKTNLKTAGHVGLEGYFRFVRKM